MSMEYRIEKDTLGEREIPAEALWGVHTLRAVENFPLAGHRCHPELIRAYGAVKLACVRTAAAVGAWREEPEKFAAIENACSEMAEGALLEHVIVDALQGGAGTSLNMNVNEVIANRALILLDARPGDYDKISPLDDVNIYQSTNDTYPTALKLAAVRSIHSLETSVVGIVEAFQNLERKFAHVVKVGRTQLQDAVLTTLGREMGAYACAFSRDRWRIYKIEERLRVVNLGGTAIGTGLSAPRQYIFRVCDTLREITGIGFARADNLIDDTQNADVYVEVSGILKALAATLIKVSSDLRLLSSGPEAGLGEIRLPARQAGSSIMPGKVNPVIPEAATQAAMLAMGNDTVIAFACASGSLELNPFLPLVANCLLENCNLLTRACRILTANCVLGIEADEERCAAHVEGSTSAATALIHLLGYETAAEIIKSSAKTGKSVRETAVSGGHISDEKFTELISPEAVCRLGFPDNEK